MIVFMREVLDDVRRPGGCMCRWRDGKRALTNSSDRRVPMRKMLLILALWFAADAAHAADWLTIAGDASDANVDTIQMDPVARKIDGAVRIMGIRVSRRMQRTSAAGGNFRSFEGLVEFDCDKQTARFVVSQFFHDPLWKNPGVRREYPATDVRPMAFRLFEPNPRERVIRAACQGRAR